jgi:uncharacterized membrane protein YqiK
MSGQHLLLLLLLLPLLLFLLLLLLLLSCYLSVCCPGAVLQACERTWQLAGACATPNMQAKVVMLAGLQMRL